MRLHQLKEGVLPHGFPEREVWVMLIAGTARTPSKRQRESERGQRLGLREGGVCFR